MKHDSLPVGLLRTLRVGDVVRVVFRHIGSGPHSQPFDVEIAEIAENANYDHKGVCRPIIQWEPRPEDYSEDRFGGPHNFADSTHIVAILKRGNRKGSARRNALAEKPFNHVQSDAPRSRTCVASSPVALARHILCRMPDLDIRLGISEERLKTLWAKDGYRGLKGRYNYSSNTVRPAGVAVKQPKGGFTFGELSIDWINVEQFKRWLLQRLPHMLTTEKELRSQARHAYKLDWEDHDRTWYGSSSSEDEDLFGSEHDDEDDFAVIA